MCLSRVNPVKIMPNMSAGFYLDDKDADCHRFISTQGICNIHDCRSIYEKKKILFIAGTRGRVFPK